MKVTACARVQVAFGLNVVAVVPLVMPLETAHATASAHHAFAGTSVNRSFRFDASSPDARYRNATICARVQTALGLKVVSVVPLVIPFSTAHSIAFCDFCQLAYANCEIYLSASIRFLTGYRRIRAFS